MPDTPPQDSSRNTILDTAVATIVGVLLLGAAGLTYTELYKRHVLRKMKIAFLPDNDPVLVLAQAGKAESEDPHGHVEREEQSLVDRIVNGSLAGSYWLVLGPKGTGKYSLFFQSILANKADGVAVIEAHEDIEVFRIRLGKALNFEFHEDNLGGLFSVRGLREGGAILDVERALNKLEKVAIDYAQRNKRPIVLIINNLHHIEDISLLHMLQQRAESWAQARVATFVFLSDDHFVLDAMKRRGTRMAVLSVRDVALPDARSAIISARHWFHGEDEAKASSIADELVKLVGGRLAHVHRYVAQDDAVAAAKQGVEDEKAWLLSLTSLIPEHDDDVMDEQKYASCSMLLFQERTCQNLPLLTYTVVRVADENAANGIEGLPSIPYHRAREVMTRTDFLDSLDRRSIINIDAQFNIRPDSTLMLRVFEDIVREPDFQERLEATQDRINAIESQHRLKDTHGDGSQVMRIQLVQTPPTDSRIS